MQFKKTLRLTLFNIFYAFSIELRQLKTSWDLSCARICETEEKVALQDKQIDAMLLQIPILETQETEISNAVSDNQNITEIRTHRSILYFNERNMQYLQ